MFIIEPKFKIGDLVKVVSKKYGLSAVFDKNCKITEVKESLRIDEPAYIVECEDSGKWFVKENQIIPVHTEREYQRVTDPNVNYEELFKEPVYIEFINISEALSKLQMFENKEAGNVYGECVELKDKPLDSIIVPGDTVFYPSKFTTIPNVHCAIVQKINPRFVTVVYPSKRTFDLKRSEVFKTYEEALAQIK